MRSFRRILVAVKDPAARPQPAVVKAAQLARALGARLELFHAITAPLYADLYGHADDGWKAAKQKARAAVCKQLEIIAHRLPRGAKVEVAADWDYPAYEAILRHAHRIKADLLVAERHVGRRFAPWFLHLNDWELLRLSPIPVLLVKTAGIYRHPVVLAAVDPTHSEKPARLDDVILSAGAVVADALRGTLHAVFAHASVLSGTRATDAFSPNKAARINAGFAAAARAQLDHLLGSTRIPRNRRHLDGNSPVKAIQRVARVIGSDMVVMGAISRSGLKRVFIGNTAESLLDELPCDLFIVKPRGFVNRVPSAGRGIRLVSLASVVH